MAIQSAVPSAIVENNNDSLNTGNVVYDPYVTQIQNNQIGTEIQKTFYLRNGKWQVSLPDYYDRYLVDKTSNLDESSALYLGEFDASGESFGAVIKKLNYIKFNIITVSRFSGNSIRPIFKYEILVDEESKAVGTFDYGQTSTNNPTMVSWQSDNVADNAGKDIKIRLWAWVYNDINGTTDSFYVYFGKYTNNTIDYYTTALFDFIGLYEKDFNLLFDIIGVKQKDFHLLFDVINNTKQKDFNLLFDVVGDTLAKDDEVASVKVNGEEYEEISRITIEQVAYTPEARRKPYLIIRFTSPIEFRLDDAVEIRSKYASYMAYITRKEPSVSDIWTYEAYSPKQHRLAVHREFEDDTRLEETNVILGHDGKLWKIGNSELLAITETDVQLISNSFSSYITNIEAPDKLYGLWKPQHYAWYTGKELANHMFEEANGTQKIVNMSFEKDAGGSVMLAGFPSQTAMFIRNLDKDIYAGAVGYVSVRFTTTNWNPWLINDDYIRIRFEGNDEDGNFCFGDIKAKIPYHQRNGASLLELGWNNVSWTTFGGYLGNGLNNSFQTNKGDLDWWIKKITVILYPLADIIVDSIFVQGNTHNAKNYAGTGENTATVELKSTDYDDVIKELETTYAKMQVQKGYTFSIPLRLSFVPPFYFIKGENLKVFKVKHDIDRHTTTFEVGTGMPTLTGGWNA